MPGSPIQWLPLAAIPVLLVAGCLAVLDWVRCIGTLSRLRRPVPDAASLARLRLAGEEHSRRAYRHGWQVVAVVGLGMSATLLVPLVARPRAAAVPPERPVHRPGPGPPRPVRPGPPEPDPGSHFVTLPLYLFALICM